MKILMVLERDFPPDLRVENEIKSLINAGHELALACFTLKNKEGNFDWNGCTIYKKRIPKFVYKSSVGILKLPFYFNFWNKFLEKIFLEFKADAIHIHDLPLAKIGYKFKQKYRVQFTLDLHENWPAYLSISAHTNTFLGKLLSSFDQWEKYEKKYCEKSDQIVVVVDEAKSRISEFVSNAEKIKVVSNTINLDDTDGLEDAKNDSITLFYGGGINYHRGLQNVIVAMQDVVKKNQNVKLWIVGDGSYKKTLEELSSRLKLEKNIIFFGYKPYKEMLSLLAKSDITLIPHLVSDHTNSTIPHKLFQYMYYNKPILVSNCAPLKRIIEETNTGLTFDVDKNEELTEVILKLVEKVENKSQEWRHGKVWVTEKYNWSFDEKVLIDLYK